MFGSMGQTNVKNLGNGGTMDGDVTITGDLTVSGGISLSLNEVLQGTSTIDINSTEALLVRKDGDGGDVFIVDTTNMDVTVNGVKNTTTFSVTNNWSTTNDFIQIALNDATIRSTVLDSGARNLILAPLGNDALTLHSTSGGVVSVGIGITPTVDLDISSSSGDVQARLFRNANVKTSLTFKNSLQEWEIGNSVGDNNKFTIRDITDSRNAFVIDGSGDTSFSGTATVSGGVLTLGTADSTSGHINAFENMSFNIDTDNDDTNRFFEFNINGNSGAGTELMRLTEGGFLGIGTTPESALHINTSSSGGIGGKLIIDNQASTADGNGTEISFFNGSGASASGVANSRIRSVSTGNTNGYSELQFYGYNTGGEALRMVIAKDGKLGVGTSSPEERIHSTGAIVSTGVNDTGATAGTERAFIDLVSNKARIGHFRGTTSAGSGGLQFYTDSVERARIDASGRLGLGISDPDAYLSGARNLVLGGTSGDHGLTIRTASDSKGIIAFGDGDASSDAGYRGQIQYLHSSDKMLFMTSTTNRMAIDSSGVGIGTSSPVGTLTINSDTAEDGVIITTTNTDAGGSADQGLGLDWRFTSVSSYPWAYVRAIFQGSGDTELAFGTKPASAGDNVAERMRIDNQGRVGIGTASPSQLLHIQGTAGLSLLESTGANQNAEFQFKTTARIFGIGQNIGTTGKFEIYDRTAGATRLVIDSSGNVGIGTTSPDSAPKLHIHKASAGSIDSHSSAVLTLEDDGSNILQFLSPSDQIAQVRFGDTSDDGAGFVSYNHDGDTMSFGAGGPTRFKLDGNSRISLGNNDSSGATSNTIFGRLAGNAIASGAIDNVLIGNEAGNDVTTGDYLVAIGSFALEKEDVGRSSVAIGASALGRQNTASEGSANTIGIGTNAGFYNVTGTDNVLIGHNAGVGADGNSHSNNVAVGSKAMFDVTTGSDNVAMGLNSLENLTSGSRNVALGYFAMAQSIDTNDTVAIGRYAMGAGDVANDGQIAIGKNALAELTSGAGNTAVGYLSLQSVDDGSKCTAVGYQAGNTTEGATKSTFIGYDTEGSGANVNNETVIGSDAVGQGGNSVTLGNADVTDVYMAQDSGATVHGAGVRMGGDSTYTNEFKISTAEVIARFRNDNNNFNGHGILIQCGKDAPASAGDNVYMLFQSGDGDGHGGIRNSSTVANPEFFNGSDLRMKKDVSETNIKGLDTINAIPLKEWNWNNEKEIPKTNIGIVADDLEKVLPELVSENTPLKGWEHCVKDGEKPLKTIPTESQLTLILMKAVQELSAKITELENK